MARVSRRHLLAGPVGAAAVVASGGLARAAGPALGGAPPVMAGGRPDWDAVRAQFRLEPGWVHLAMYHLASHPRVVREAVAHLSRQIDANPLAAPGGCRCRTARPGGRGCWPLWPTTWERGPSNSR